MKMDWRIGKGMNHILSNLRISVSPYLRFSHLLLVTCYSLLVVGCGYTIHGRASLPFDSIRIGKIENKTVEPKLEDRMQRALADELMKNGIQVVNSSGYVLNGVIKTFELKGLSEKEGVMIEYEVVIRGRFYLVDPSGKTKELKDSGSFIASFSSADSLQNVMTMKEEAIKRALKDMATEIVASIIYR